MTKNPAGPTRTTQVSVLHAHLIATAEEAGHTFEMRFTSSPRGARLARRLAAERLDRWGVPYGTRAHDDVTLIVAELAANAVRHGHVPGRDFRLRLHVVPEGREGHEGHERAVRVEVTDTRTERLPRLPSRPAADARRGTEEGGRGLFLVAHLAARCGWHPRSDGPGKTVWAEYVSLS
ncbi:ATP-binding protein [Streptomyces sp. NPDC005925]|uniref:ATP-binding protein n=1 Tax=Streptomyces sp. NPDC005925 TaxID=3157172 RepID=UPI0033EA11A2